jgi:hypothetical protein
MSEEFETWMKSDKCTVNPRSIRWDMCSAIWHYQQSKIDEQEIRAKHWKGQANYWRNLANRLSEELDTINSQHFTERKIK